MTAPLLRLGGVSFDDGATWTWVWKRYADRTETQPVTPAPGMRYRERTP